MLSWWWWIHNFSTYIKYKDDLTSYLISKRKGHYDETKTEVGKGQGGNEPVLDQVEAVFSGDGDNDQHVAHHHHHHHQRDQDGQHDYLGVCVLAGEAVRYLSVCK